MYYILWAVGLIVVATALKIFSPREKTIRLKLLSIFGILLLATAPVLIQIGTQQIFQERSTRAFLQISVNKEKILSIKNTGLVTAEDIKVFLTIYKLQVKYDASNHRSIKGLDSFSEVSGSIKNYNYLRSGENVTFDLKNLLLPFYDWSSRSSDRVFDDVYTLRIV